MSARNLGVALVAALTLLSGCGGSGEGSEEPEVQRLSGGELAEHVKAAWEEQNKAELELVPDAQAMLDSFSATCPGLKLEVDATAECEVTISGSAGTASVKVEDEEGTLFVDFD